MSALGNSLLSAGSLRRVLPHDMATWVERLNRQSPAGRRRVHGDGLAAVNNERPAVGAVVVCDSQLGAA
jgi:hypothetical protein